ncbi:MFS transporter [Candidatus Bathyarchaeota archaeon]|nr:MFS transporter [Candidatus Bathyarchaeota archaeon]MBT4320817.1 MFS transporter [Candidatus Bathyarchaeota archaeon]MBT4423091.1 MFS transporter [Candidatus Bathyarchaeota archaeon]MBT5643016.1 MFS transporter [Candidatus Bathyarchaeota archaeon]MBT6605473.1 MFS transporter [Candidatus Bathyarchaeota archaeon]
MAENKQKKQGLLSYGLIVMAISHTLTHVFGGIHTAVFSQLREEFDLNLQQLGLIASIPSLASAILAIPVGLLSDRIGPKKMLLMSFGFAGLGAILAGTASTPLMLIAAVSLIYINTAIYHPASYSATAKMFKPEDRAKAMGLHGAGGTLGHAMGPLSVSLLVGLLAWQWRQVYLFLAAPMFIGILMVLKLPDDKEENVEKKQKKKSTGEKFLTTSLIMFLAYQATRMIASSMMNTFLVLYLQDVRGMSLTVSTFLQSTNTLTGLVFAPIGGYLAAKYGDKQWLQVSLLGAFTILALAFQIPNNTLFMSLYVLYGVGNTLGMAGRSAIMAKLTPSGQRGLGYALFFLPGSIIGAITPVVAGYVADIMGFQTIFNVAVVVNFLALGILKFAVKVD